MGIPYDRTVAAIDRLHEMCAAGDLPFTPEVSRVGDGSALDDAFRAWTAERWPALGTRVWERYDFLEVGDVTSRGGVPDFGCQHWFRLPILASGRVVFCCADSHGLAPIDDLAERTMLEVYNEPSRRTLRMRVPSRHEVDPCFACERL